MYVACNIAALTASSSARAAINPAIPAGRRDGCDIAARNARVAAMMNQIEKSIARNRLTDVTTQYGNVMYPESTDTLRIGNDFKKLMA